jgi:hypothetical protein
VGRFTFGGMSQGLDDGGEAEADYSRRSRSESVSSFSHTEDEVAPGLCKRPASAKKGAKGGKGRGRSSPPHLPNRVQDVSDPDERSILQLVPPVPPVHQPQPAGGEAEAADAQSQFGGLDDTRPDTLLHITLHHPFITPSSPLHHQYKCNTQSTSLVNFLRKT